jgi:hypothetical protein
VSSLFLQGWQYFPITLVIVGAREQFVKLVRVEILDGPSIVLVHQGVLEIIVSLRIWPWVTELLYIYLRHRRWLGIRVPDRGSVRSHRFAEGLLLLIGDLREVPTLIFSSYRDPATIVFTTTRH